MRPRLAPAALAFVIASCVHVVAPAPTADVLPEAAVATGAFLELCPSCSPASVVADPEHGDTASIGGGVIRYSPARFAAISIACGRDALVGIFAHEYGHALGDHFGGEPDDAWARELLADRWAGCELALARRAPAGLVCFFDRFAAEGGDSHPPAYLRTDAVVGGFATCAP